jgi:hypothetical protein
MDRKSERPIPVFAPLFLDVFSRDKSMIATFPYAPQSTQVFEKAVENEE